MCGIYLSNICKSSTLFTSRLESIKFRGPDYTGVKRVDSLLLGHLRLAILDLDHRSNQPYEFDKLILIFNGEIYNYQEVRGQLIELGYAFETTGDTEVLIKGYDAWGKDIVNKINGMFSFVIYDKVSNKLFAARDRLGVKPFYYYWNNGQLEICSQLRPISQDKILDEEALAIYFDCGYIPSPYSIFKGVKKLDAGCIMEVDFSNNSLEISTYWDIADQKTSNINYTDAKNKLHELLVDATKIRLGTDVPLGSFLSGGIDSALISSIAARNSDQKLNTFSIGFEEKEYDESAIARQYASIIGSNHTETICKSEDFIELIPKLVEVYDEPFADSSALPSLLLNKVTKQYVTVALSGDGGDESFLGYSHLDSVSKVKGYFKLPNLIRRGLKIALLVLNIKRVSKIVNLNSIEEFIQSIFIGYGSLAIDRNLNWLKNYKKYLSLSSNPFQKTADLNIKLWLQNDSNVKVDRASMAFSVEVRSPFLDYRIIEFARTLPIHFRFDNKNGIKKKILRDILKEYIPEKIFNQPKRGFAVPLAHWMRGELREDFERQLTENFLDKIPNFNKLKFKTLFANHLAGKEDNSVYIWRIYVFSLWCQEFDQLK